MFGGICVWNCETAMCQRVSAPLEKISGMQMQPRLVPI
jgi:hypothetical protein